MIVSIIKGKAKNWKELFKKEFGGLPSDTTLEDVVKHKASILGNHVDRFKRKKQMNNKTVQASNLESIVKSDQASSKKEKEMSSGQIQVYMNQLLKQSLRSMRAT